MPNRGHLANRILVNQNKKPGHTQLRAHYQIEDSSKHYNSTTAVSHYLFPTFSIDTILAYSLLPS